MSKLYKDITDEVRDELINGLIENDGFNKGQAKKFAEDLASSKPVSIPSSQKLIPVEKAYTIDPPRISSGMFLRKFTGEYLLRVEEGHEMDSVWIAEYVDENVSLPAEKKRVSQGAFKSAQLSASKNKQKADYGG